MFRSGPLIPRWTVGMTAQHPLGRGAARLGPPTPLPQTTRLQRIWYKITTASPGFRRTQLTRRGNRKRFPKLLHRSILLIHWSLAADNQGCRLPHSCTPLHDKVILRKGIKNNIPDCFKQKPKTGRTCIRLSSLPLIAITYPFEWTTMSIIIQGT